MIAGHRIGQPESRFLCRAEQRALPEIRNRFNHLVCKALFPRRGIHNASSKRACVMHGDHVPHHLREFPADAVFLGCHVLVVKFYEALIELGRMAKVLDPLRAVKRLITGTNDRLELPNPFSNTALRLPVAYDLLGRTGGSDRHPNSPISGRRASVARFPLLAVGIERLLKRELPFIADPKGLAWRDSSSQVRKSAKTLPGAAVWSTS